MAVTAIVHEHAYERWPRQDLAIWSQPSRAGWEAATPGRRLRWLPRPVV